MHKKNSQKLARKKWSTLSAVGVLAGVMGMGGMSSAYAVEAPDQKPSIIHRLADKTLLTDVVESNGHYLAVGVHGTILHSLNGTDWTQAQIPVRNLLNAVTLTENGHAWAVGHDAVILHSADWGKTWELQYYEPEIEIPYLGVLFTDDNIGYVVGAYGHLMITADGGKNWTREPLKFVDPASLAEEGEEPMASGFDEYMHNEDFDLHLNAIVSMTIDDKPALFIAGEMGTALRSFDLGKSWQPMAVNYEGSFFGTTNPVGSDLFVYGLRGSVYHSKDAGVNWVRVDNKNKETLFDSVPWGDDKLAIVGLGGRVLIVEKNSGELLESVSLPGGPGNVAALSVENGELLTVGWRGVDRVKVSQ